MPGSAIRLERSWPEINGKLRVDAALALHAAASFGNLADMSAPETSPPSEPTDVQLMQQAAEGSRAAFEALVRRHQQPLLNFFWRMGVYTDAEDLVQETMVRVYRWRGRYRPTAKFTTFLYTVARNVMLDAWRRSKRRAELAEELQAEGRDADDGGMARARLRLDVQPALRRLPEKLRSVVVLNVYQGLRYEEIGRILRIPEGTVKSRMFTALGRLKEMFDDRTR